LRDAKLTLGKINLISVTAGPGLLGSLLTGISFAKAVALAKSIPLVGVDHVHSHFYANFLNAKGVKLPFVALVVSGGHTSLFFVRDFDKIEVLGETQDDACGEAFDKVAKILKLGYPGGPYIEKMAKLGDAKKYPFRCSGTKEALNFSFSGIKTAVLYLVKDKRLNATQKKDICASFQETVLESLVQKSLLACDQMKTKRLVIGGGVVANTRLREKFNAAASRQEVVCYFPPKELCMDNAAMVAGFGFQLYKKGYICGQDLSAALN
jgi:N6-L-threonylcarbamoyladenine synthase